MEPYVFIALALVIATLIPTGSVTTPHEAVRGIQEAPEKITVCQLQSDPAKYNHKLLEVTGFISHGFEDFGVFDPKCESKNSIWLDYGGTKASDTMYCCGVVPGHTRPQVASIESISIPLVDDDRFKEFDKMIRTERDLIMNATIVGRFFAGEKTKYPAGEFWGGYGHLGCCMLLMIEQVRSVEAHNRADLDYRASADQPNTNKVGCGYRILGDDTQFRDLIESQGKAEEGQRAWAFEDPKRVAIELLAREAKADSGMIQKLAVTRQTPGRIVYKWSPPKSRATYMVVVSRPYVMSFYARDPNKVAWMVVAAYRIGCGSDF